MNCDLIQRPFNSSANQETPMLTKIYWSIWAVMTSMALLLFITGNFTMLAGVVFGFAVFGLTFMGMIVVLPLSITHPSHPKIPETKSVPDAEPRAGHILGHFKSA